MASSRLRALAGINEMEEKECGVKEAPHEEMSRMQQLRQERENIKVDVEVLRIEKRKNLIKEKLERAKLSEGEEHQKVLELEAEIGFLNDKSIELGNKIMIVSKLQMYVDKLLNNFDEGAASATALVADVVLAAAGLPSGVGDIVLSKKIASAKRIMIEMSKAFDDIVHLLDVVGIVRNLEREIKTSTILKESGGFNERFWYNQEWVLIKKELERVKPMLDDFCYQTKLEQLHLLKRNEEIEEEVLKMLV